MSEQSERLLEAMSELPDAQIDAGAEEPPRKKSHWKRWAALAACLAVAALGVGTLTGLIPLQFGATAGGSGHDAATTFMSYAGPVFPLTLAEENEAITAERDITLDFAPWEPFWHEADFLDEGGFWKSGTDILVTDAYTLQNQAAEDQAVTVLYPFASSLLELETYLPTLTLDGAEAETALYVGAYSGGFEGAYGRSLLEGDPAGSDNLDYAESWEDYTALLQDGTYLANALADGPDVSGIPVTVYRFTDPYGPAADDAAPNPYIRVAFDLDYAETTVLSCGFNAGWYDPEGGTMMQGFSLRERQRSGDQAPYYLVILGQDVQNMTVGGYVTGGTDADTKPLAGCGVTVERYESDLDTALREVAAQIYREIFPEEAPAVDFETCYRAFLEYLLAYGPLSDDPTDRYSNGWLEDVVSGAWSVDRVCWLAADVTVPAGCSVTLTASMAKAGSYDFYCADRGNRGLYGYDLVTALGSCLTCTEQRATLEDQGFIEIVRQNFGFDLAQGVKTVALDPAEPHYYLEVRRQSGTIPQSPPEAEP